MDWRALGSAFLVILLAELGDKTQLAILGLASGAGSRMAVFVGAAAALVLATAVAVLLGQALGRAILEIWLRRGAGVLFRVLGVLFLAERPG